MKNEIFEHKEWILGISILLLVGGAILVRSGRVPFFDKRAQGSETVATKTEPPIDLHISRNATSKDATVTVYVCGFVKKPGLYSLSVVSRVGDALTCAGGFTSQAAREALNLAEVLKDGEQLYFPSKKEFKQAGSSGSNAQNFGSGEQGSTNKVNLNTATQSEIEALSGVGPVTAQKIVSYREEKGKISSFEDLKNIPGIGDKRVETIEAEAVVK